jgi:hypothetical protein
VSERPSKLHTKLPCCSGSADSYSECLCGVSGVRTRSRLCCFCTQSTHLCCCLPLWFAGHSSRRWRLL